MKSNTSTKAARATPRRTKEERDRQVGINGLAAKTSRSRAKQSVVVETVEQFEARGGKVEILETHWVIAA